ncbi:MAG: WD40 repeat domain-containing protein [Phenylobacterium sp.]|nr:WD40 repeat domain-containing protein [Phenylobacterium sp.]
MTFDFDAYVTSAHFDRAGRAVFALGDGSVRYESGEVIEAHDGAVLSACLPPSGDGLLTGGDDGRVVLSTPAGAAEIAKAPGRWIEALDASGASNLIAFGAGRELHVRDLADATFSRVFTHEKSVAQVAFDPKGRRLAVATYGGVWLWYARIADQKPVTLKWAGSHIGLCWSPDGKFLVSSMQENQLHGWRVADEKNMRMGGYPAKVRSLAFLHKGALLATSGANGAVCWPFAGATGPMGKEAAEIGWEESALSTRIATAPDKTWVAAGLDDGRVWAADVSGERMERIKSEKGAAITALALSPDAKRVAWGDEDGNAGLAEIA